ncbi:PREDICTED: solute carrier family 43 member 3, partial [Nanorana parkeri]|uniref:solute carrier family 43 member 3 n=1 Tax=Nanorana parkeri TaxID=125878 RepID=UPI00085416A2
VLYQNGISLKTSFLFLSCCSSVHILRTLFLLPKGHIPYPLPAEYNYGVSCGKAISKNIESMDSSAPPNDAEKSQDAKDLAAKAFLNRQTKHDEQPEVSFWSCAFTSLFGWHLVWISLMQLRHYLFIGTLNTTITHLSGGDLHTVSKYTNVFAVSQFCGILCAPWNGLIMDRHKRKNKDTEKHDDLHSSILSLTLTAIQCILFSLCASIPLLPALYPTFIFQVLNRSFLYGGNAAFLSIAFPAKHFGKLYGLAMSLSAVISLLQYPAFYIIRTHLHGDPLYVNIFLAVLMLVTFAHPINIFRVCRKDKKASQDHVQWNELTGWGRPEMTTDQDWSDKHADKHMLFQLYRSQRNLVAGGHRILLFADYSAELTKRRKKCQAVCQALVHQSITFALAYPATLRITSPDGNVSSFTSSEKARASIQNMADPCSSSPIKSPLRKKRLDTNS